VSVVPIIQTSPTPEADRDAAEEASSRAEPIRFNIGLTGAEGSGVRVLGLIVRRGWYLAGAELLPGRPGDKRRMTVDVLRRDETRRLETLKNQLERLHDVTDVDYFDPAEEGERHG
jgi:acetolactate synthase regulatory subunit